jgi:hypothetical protein
VWYRGISLGSDDVRDTESSRCTCSTGGGEIAMDATTESSIARSTSDAASYDESYQFGRRPTVRAPFPFTEREFARLLIARGRVQADPSADDQLAA